MEEQQRDTAVRGHAPEIKPLDQEAEQSVDALRVDGREMGSGGVVDEEENGLIDPPGRGKDSRRQGVENERRKEKRHRSTGKQGMIQRQESLHDEDEQSNALTPHSIPTRYRSNSKQQKEAEDPRKQREEGDILIILVSVLCNTQIVTTNQGEAKPKHSVPIQRTKQNCISPILDEFR